MENNNTTLTVQGKEQKKNPVSRFFSAVNAKRKKIMLTLTTMVTMSMMSTGIVCICGIIMVLIFATVMIRMEI